MGCGYAHARANEESVRGWGEAGAGRGRAHGLMGRETLDMDGSVPWRPRKPETGRVRGPGPGPVLVPCAVVWLVCNLGEMCICAAERTCMRLQPQRATGR